MKYFETYSDYSKDWKHIDDGSEAQIFTDGEWVYRVTHDNEFDHNRIYEKIKNHIKKRYKNVVWIEDIWYDKEKELSIIQMEDLEKIPQDNIDNREFLIISDELCYIEDEVGNLPAIIEMINDPIIKKMVSDMYNGCLELGLEIFDMGFHNLMLDPRTGEYKIIDYF